MREGIKSIIKWEEEGFIFAGEASDGELAYPLIMKTKPDIIITDIQMPFMDGLELSSLIKNELPGIKIIILSGYGEFEYAKRAISVGVTEYLLKPISAAKLLEVLKKVQDEIEQERKNEELKKQFSIEKQNSLRSEKERLCCSLILGRISVKEALEEGSSLGVKLDASVYQVMLFKMIAQEGETEGNREAEQAREELWNLMQKETAVEVFSHGIEGFLFLLKGEDEEKCQILFQHCCHILEEFSSQYPHLNYFGGVGKSVFRLRDIPKSYRDAARAFASRFFMELNTIVSHDDILTVQAAENGALDLQEIQASQAGRERMKEFLKNAVFEETEGFIETYFHQIGEKNYNSILFRQYIAMDCILIAVDFLKELGVKLEDYPEELKNINVSCVTMPLEELKGYLKGILQKTISIRDSLSQSKYIVLLEQAKNYINENFQSDISLNTVAGKVNISPSYLSSLFKQETGETFVEYLTKLRIDKAKELLMCTSLRSTEIGFEVGYKDSHYFSNIFKKVTGCSPKEYRSRGKRG